MNRYAATAPPRVQEALKILGIDNFLLGIHAAAFPSLPAEDIGCGSPYSDGAAALFRFGRELGFDGFQLGPQGITSPDNPSPYDGTFFSRNPLSLAPLGLVRAETRLLAPENLAGLVGQSPAGADRVDRDSATRASQTIAAEACRRYRLALQEDAGGNVGALRAAFARFRRRHAGWLARDALYQALVQVHGGRGWQYWGDTAAGRLDQTLFAPPAGKQEVARRRIRTLRRRHHRLIEDYCFLQFLLAEQHDALQQTCRSLGLKLFGDCQIGFSERDAWFAQSFLLPGYLLGAPPSRTNPAGQPWNYPLLDPRRYDLKDAQGKHQPGPAVRFFQARINRLLDEFDGLRIDHPHGLICPWVYRAGQEDPLRAVQTGARLFASPALADHPELASFAIARPDQINQQTARYADDWVVSLYPDQVRRYGRLFEVVMTTARQRGRDKTCIACEILSTQPYPIKQVMESYGLGRFRVTQKMNLDRPSDVYRSENAEPQDWLMLGNHDTASIWRVAKGWVESGAARRQADYLADRLGIPGAERAQWVARCSADPGHLAQAKFADLFVGPARNVMVFFTDLFGLLQSYNQPGSISEANWSLRIETDYRSLYRARLRRNRALNIPAALVMALRAKGATFAAGHRDLIADLESLALAE